MFSLRTSGDERFTLEECNLTFHELQRTKDNDPSWSEIVMEVLDDKTGKSIFQLNGEVIWRIRALTSYPCEMSTALEFFSRQWETSITTEMVLSYMDKHDPWAN